MSIRISTENNENATTSRVWAPVFTRTRLSTQIHLGNFSYSTDGDSSDDSSSIRAIESDSTTE